ARQYGWPNTYVFTKAMGEMLIGQLRGDLPVFIIRPYIITSTIKEPFRGWIEVISLINRLAIGYGKCKIPYFVGDPELVIDLISIDMVANAMVVAAIFNANQPSQYIYHVSKSLRKPLKSIKLRDYGHEYFSRNPWINEHGKPVKVTMPIIFSTMESFRGHTCILYYTLSLLCETAEDVVESLAIPLMKLVGLKTEERADEGRSSTILMDSTKHQVSKLRLPARDKDQLLRLESEILAAEHDQAREEKFSGDLLMQKRKSESQGSPF
ncbi:hypothetical protein GIB67_008159, partial [Kingdonia uniflora]